MPLAAFALKENLAGAVGFKTADNEHAAASLGDSEVASVQSSPRNAIPELLHFAEKPSEVSPFVGTEEPRDVFQQEPPRSASLSKVEEGEGEAAPLAGEPCALSCEAEVLAGEPSAPDVCFWDVIRFNLRDASQIWSVWESLSQHCAGVWINFAEADGPDPGAFKAEIKSAHSAEKGGVPHFPSPFFLSFLAQPSPTKTEAAGV